MNYLCTIPDCLSSTTKKSGLYASGRVNRWRTHMIKMHGLSKDEVQNIVKKGIPIEKNTPKVAEAHTDITEEFWTLAKMERTLRRRMNG